MTSVSLNNAFRIISIKVRFFNYTPVQSMKDIGHWDASAKTHRYISKLKAECSWQSVLLLKFCETRYLRKLNSILHSYRGVYQNTPNNINKTIYKDNYTNNADQNYKTLLKALIRSPGTDTSFPASSTAEELTLLILLGGLPGRNGTWNMEVQIGWLISNINILDI